MTQLSLFSESELDSPCRTCLFSNWDVAYVNNREANTKLTISCSWGQFRLTRKLHVLPNKCGVYKEYGGEHMAYIDFKKMSEEQLRTELKKLRESRVKAGSRNRRMASEKRQGTPAKKKEKDISDAEFV